MPDLRRLLVPLFAGYVALFAVLLHTSGRHVPLWLYGSSTVLFVGLVAVLSRVPSARLPLLVLAGAAVLQVVALTQGPTTSDDVYRYLWDGRVQFSGTDPYAYAPVSSHLSHLRDGALFPPATPHCQWPIPGGCSLINRPTVRTVYPPVAQLVFDVGHVLSFGSGDRGTGGVHVFQVLAALGVLGVTALLLRAAARAGRPVWPVALWAWSPLVVVEYGNNAHVDWSAVLLSLGCLEVARRGRAGWTGVLLAAATLTKLYPALIGPALLRRRPWLVLAAAAATVVVAYVPHVLAAGTDVIGYLPGYLHEEGYNSGTRLLLLGAVLPHPLDTVAGAAVLAAAAVWCWRRSHADAPEDTAVVLVGVAFLVTTPSYGWYAGLLLALAVLARRLEWVPVAFAPAFVYLVRTEISHTSWYGTAIYAAAGALTLALGFEQRRRRATSLVEVGVR